MKTALQTKTATYTARAMTLVEMMTAASVFLLAMGGMLTLHIFGLKYDMYVSSKLGASDQSRRSYDLLLRDIRGANGVTIGGFSSNTFTPLSLNVTQQGNAIRLNYTTNFTTNVLIYYFDTNNAWLCRKTNGKAGFDIMATDITNTFIFKGENYLGQVLTSIDAHTVIGVVLQFYEFKYPKTRVGSNFLYDYYKLEFKVAPRNWY